MADTLKAKAAPTRRAVRWMRKRGWGHRVPSNGLRSRTYALAISHHRWWDWGHRVMILTGSDFGGNWAAPNPPTWWYRLGKPKPMARTKYPQHPLSTFEVITDYKTFRARTEGLNEDGLYEWSAICTDQDGELQLGHRYWGGQFYGLTHWEVALLRRYLRMWRRLDWFGLRSWLYSQGLHAAVHDRKPFACQVTPPRGSGGYSHWHCDQPRRHDGPHRFKNYTWDEAEPRVAYEPSV